MATYVAYPTNEQEKFLKAFLEALEIPFIKDDEQEELPQHVLDGIARGQADIEAGRFITFEEFKKRLPSQ
jgi:predicted transcriptional regulator